MSQQPPIRHFAILTFGKTGSLRYLSHLDLARAIERAVRRAGLPVKYSEGFNPSPRIGYSSALPVGTAGERELAQIELEHAVPADELHRALAEELPEDLDVIGVEVVSGPRRKHVSGHKAADYLVELRPAPEISVEGVREAAVNLLDAGSIRLMRETKSQLKEVDIRPGLLELSVLEPLDPDSGVRLQMSLALEQDRLTKPSEVLEALERQLRAGMGQDVGLDVRVATRLGLRM